MTWQEKLNEIMRLVLEFIEITHPVRPGQQSLGIVKNAAAVNIMQTLIMTGNIGGVVPIEAFEARFTSEAINSLVAKMQAEGRLGGVGKSGAPTLPVPIDGDRTWLDRLNPLINLGASLGTAAILRSKSMSPSPSVSDMVNRVLRK